MPFSAGESSTSRVPTWLGRNRQTPIPTADVAASTHSATCMFEMKGASFCSESPLLSPEKIAKRVALGMAEVTIASTKAIESTAPVFCRSVLAPAATPLRLAGTVPIIAAVFGLLNIPEPTPTISSQSPLCQ